MGTFQRQISNRQDSRRGGKSSGAIRVWTEKEDIGGLIRQLKSVTGNNNYFFHDIISKAGQEVEALMKNQIISNGTVASGMLRDSIRTFVSKKNPNFIWIGPDYRIYNGQGGGYHAHFIEYGTKERYMKKGLLAGDFTRKSGGSQKFKGPHKWKPYAGKYTGRMKGDRPFLRPVHDLYGNQILKMIYEGAQSIIFAECEKQGIKIK